MKVGEVGVEPLRPGAEQTVHYRLERAAGARSGSTMLRFVLLQRDPHGMPITDCSTANDTYRLAV